VLLLGSQDLECNLSGGQPWAIERYTSIVDDTDGLYAAVMERRSDDCEYTDAETLLVIEHLAD
jgi:hypothetical protein